MKTLDRNKDHVAINRDFWNDYAPEWVEMGERAWATNAPTWGNWRIPEAELNLLPSDMTGKSSIELGCGTGYVSRWLEVRGAQATGIDVSKEQLATAKRLASEYNSKMVLIEGNAEATGLPDSSFDFAISEYGAAIWCDPEMWLPEAWRLLKPGGKLVFLGNHPLTIAASPWNGEPVSFGLHRPLNGLSGADWTDVEFDPSGIEFNRSIGDWFKLFHKVGFVVEDYLEIFAPDSASGETHSCPADWAKKYPSEQVWKLRRG